MYTNARTKQYERSEKIAPDTSTPWKQYWHSRSLTGDESELVLDIDFFVHYSFCGQSNNTERQREHDKEESDL